MTRPALPVFVTPTAAAQIDAVREWWLQHRPGAPGAVDFELERALQLLELHPASGIPATSSRLSGVRRLWLRRIDYFLYYRVPQRKGRVEVLRLWHARRGRQPRL